MKSHFFSLPLAFLLTLVFSLQVQAVNGQRRIQREKISCFVDNYTKVNVTLDDSSFFEGTPYREIVKTSISDGFMHIHKSVCSGAFNLGDFREVKCAGYYSSQSDVMEFKFSEENGVVMVSWQGFSGEEMKTPCTVTQLNDYIITETH